MTRDRKPSGATLRRALETVMRARGMTFAYLDKHYENPALFAGALASGTIQLDDVDVEIKIHVRQAVKKADVGTLRDAALSLMVREPWRWTSCSATVKRRDPWSISGGNRDCRHPVSTVLVFDGVDTRYFTFVCKHHSRTNGGEAIVTLLPADIKSTRAEIVRLRRLRDEAEQRGERWDENNPEVDISIERVLGRKK